MKQISQQERRLEKIVSQVRALAEGRSIAAGTVTLTINVTTTTVTKSIISAGCFPVLFPTTANGAAELGAGTIYVSSVVSGSFVITHANNATAGRTFNYLAIGG